MKIILWMFSSTESRNRFGILQFLLRRSTLGNIAAQQTERADQHEQADDVANEDQGDRLTRLLIHLWSAPEQQSLLFTAHLHRHSRYFGNAEPVAGERAQDIGRIA